MPNNLETTALNGTSSHTEQPITTPDIDTGCNPYLATSIIVGATILTVAAAKVT